MFYVDEFRLAYPITFSLFMMLVTFHRNVPFKLRGEAMVSASQSEFTCCIKDVCGGKTPWELIRRYASSTEIKKLDKVALKLENSLTPFAKCSMLAQKEIEPFIEDLYTPQSGTRVEAGIDKAFECFTRFKPYVVPGFVPIKEASSTCAKAFLDNGTGQSAISYLLTYVGAVYTGLQLVNQIITFFQNPLKRKYKSQYQPQSGLPDAMIEEALASPAELSTPTAPTTAPKPNAPRKPLGFAGFDDPAPSTCPGHSAVKVTPSFTGKTHNIGGFGGGI
jgi:hypothetical protein